MADIGKGRLERGATIALTVAALVMAAAVVYREFEPRPARAASVSSAGQGGNHVAEWRDLLRFGRPQGPTGAPILLIIEFVDLECPACGAFHQTTLPELRHEFGDRFSLTLIHLPLKGHRFAVPGAQAAECAAEQDRFGQFVDLVMRKQDSLGLKSWASYAEEAGIGSISAFTECGARPGMAAFVDSGMAAARRLGINATPTILVNGWQIGSPSAAEVARVIAAVGSGRAPYLTGGAKSQEP